MNSDITAKASQQKLEQLSKGNIARLLWDYSLPAVVGMLVMSLYNVIDRIFIGQGVGTEAIAGLAITFPVMNISTALGVLVGAGASSRVSILLGAGNSASAQKVLGNAFSLIIINAAIYLSVFAIFLDPILLTFGASETSLPYAHDFMLYILPGLLVMNIGFTLNNVMRASGYPVRAMVTMFIGAGCNTILAPIFIFVLKWGIKGAAIATDISMLVFAIVVVRHFMSRKSTLHFTPGCFRLSLPTVLSIIGIGAAPALINIAACFINVLINKNLYFYGGDNAVAAAGIFVTFTSLLVMVVIGICQGMQPIIGYNYGAAQLDRLRKAYLLAVAASTVIVTIGCVAGVFIPHLIARAFTSDADLIKCTAESFTIAMVMFWMVGFQIVTSNFFQSIGKVAQSIFLSLTRQVIFLIPLLLILPDRYALSGVWMAFPASDALATLVTAILIIIEFRSINKKLANHK